MRPSMLIFHCPACGAGLQLPASMEGVAGPCPKCGVMIRAPAICTPVLRSEASEPSGGRPGKGAAGRRAGTGSDGEPTKVSEGSGKQIPPLPSAKEVEKPMPGRPLATEPRGMNRLNRPVGPRIAEVRRIEPVAPQDPESDGVRQGSAQRRRTSRRWLVAAGVPLAFLLACAALIVFIVYLLRPPVEDEDLRRGGDDEALPRRSETGAESESVSPGGVPKVGEEGKSADGVGGAAVEVVPDRDEEPRAMPPEAGGDVSLATQAGEALDRFLLSDLLEERMPVLISHRSPEELAGTSLAGRLPQPVTPMLEKRIDTPGEALIEFFFRVEFPDAVAPNPRLITVAVRYRGDGTEPPKVLADPFIDLFDGGLVDFAGEPCDGARTFHVFLEAVPICEDSGIPDPGKKITLRLRPNPKAKELANAYASKNSMVAQMLEPPRPSLHWGAPCPCVVSLSWNVEVPTKPFVELVKIDSFTWTR